MKKRSPGSLLSIEPLQAADIQRYLLLAKRMNPARPRQLLRGKRVVLLFYEASTRTRTSFEFAAKALGATTTLISATASSIEKGESLIDTAATIRALGADCIIMRHPSSGAHWILDRHLDIPIINAGDGMHEHPSQALLDAYTMLEHFKSLKGLRVAMVGDIFHSRVARSNAHLLTKMGAQVTYCGPKSLAPELAIEIAPGLRLSRDFDEVIPGSDVVMMLRVQKERLAGMDIDLGDYIARYQMNRERLRTMKKGAILMHPGPMIRGMEITDEAADAPNAVILPQVANGVRMRMAILAHHLGGGR